MNKTTEALKMALNALYVADAIAIEYTGVELKRIEPAINACKEALESQEEKEFFERGKKIAKWADSQEQEPYGWVKDGVFYFKKPDDVFIYKPLYTHPTPIQEQEPVDVARVQVDGSVEWRPDMPDFPVGTKLYIHPAQPLSDDEIRILARLWHETDMYIEEFARAIEAAHGIGVKE